MLERSHPPIHSDSTQSGSSRPSRRRFLQYSALAGAGVAATTLGAPAAFADQQGQNGQQGQNDQRGGGNPDPLQFDPLRPPAIPLAVRSPYLSTWLTTDNLPGTWPSFWTGRVTAMAGLATIDGTTYVFLGAPALPNTYPFPTMRQISVQTTATSSRFVLQQGGVELDITFLSPVEPGDLRRQCMPLSYVSAQLRSVDNKPHKASLYLDISGEWASGNSDTPITWDEQRFGGSGGANLISLTCTPSAPRVFAEANEAAEWGTVVWSTPDRPGLTWQIGADAAVRAQVIDKGALLDTVDQRKPRPINDHYPVFGFNLDLGTVSRKKSAPFVISIGHVREPAINYLGTPLPPLWKSYYPSWQAMVAAFHADFDDAGERANRLDRKINTDAERAGGKRYAALCSLALRQAYAGTELVSHNGQPWAFLKEISSSGNVSTIDLIYPGMPVLLYADPAYLELLLAPIFDYVENNTYPKTFAPHDLGTHYPNADGHLSGQGEEDMPVEESANMLIMTATLLNRLPAAAATAFAQRHYKFLKQWADYLVGNALDPGFQNQTDDFTGFIGHSVNLALKGIVGIGAMSQVATKANKPTDASGYLATARSYITQWAQKAQDNTGNHLKLAYDQPGTWSLKYNGYADRVLGLGLVSPTVAAEEAAWYLSRANTYGVPLDIRHTLTKNDWEMWTAAWLKDHADIRNLLIDSVYEFATTTPSRVPITDWYETVTDRQDGFQARPVVGGFFALLTV